MTNQAKKSIINVRVEEDVKQEADKIFKEMGLNMSVAVNLYLRQVVRTGMIPFEIKVDEKGNDDE